MVGKPVPSFPRIEIPGKCSRLACPTMVLRRSFLCQCNDQKSVINLIRLTKQLRELSALDRSRLDASKQLVQADLPETPN